MTDPNPLADARTALAAAVNLEDLAVYSSPPTDEEIKAGSVEYPLAYVVPGDPYLAWEEGLMFGAVAARHDIVFTCNAGASQENATELDTWVLKLVNALAGSEVYVVTQVRQPGLVTLNEVAHLAVSIEVRSEITL